jgi:dCTP deaminase
LKSKTRDYSRVFLFLAGVVRWGQKSTKTKLCTMIKKILSAGKGALPYQSIVELIDAGFITGAKPENISPASLDLSISGEIYEVESIFQPRAGETIRDVLKKTKKRKHSLNDPIVPGKMYMACLNEKFDLPSSIYGYCNPKSSSGRLDLHVRLMVDGVESYDAMTPAGFSGEAWILIISNSFFCKLNKNQPLNQVRFFNADTRLSDWELETSMKKDGLIWIKKGEALTIKDMPVRDNDNSIILTLELSGQSLGFEAKKTNKIIDLNKKKFYRWNDFFRPVKMKKGFVHLKKNGFYILSTYEGVNVPLGMACEMASMDDRRGEFRSHYAGFIDPRFNAQLTLEVRPREDMLVRHRMPIAKIKFERLMSDPEVDYGSKDSNYIRQVGPTLGKQFKM